MLKHLADYYTLELAATVKAQFPKNCGMVELYWARRLNGGTEVKQGACEIDKGGSAAGYYVVVGTRNPSVVGHIQSAISTNPWFYKFRPGDFVPRHVRPGEEIGFRTVPEVPGVS